MKIHSPKIEIPVFSIILLFVVIPPFFIHTQNAGTFTQWTFPFSALISFALGLLLWIFWKDSKHEKTDAFNPVKFLLFQIMPAILCCCFLFCTALVFKFLTYIPVLEKFTVPVLVNKPSAFLEYVFCFMNFAFAAFFEEAVYRFYIPGIFQFFILKRANPKVARIITEILSTILFAFGHIYLGVLSVLNAAIAHLILRLCLKKTNNIYSGFAAHFIYNLLVLFLF